MNRGRIAAWLLTASLALNLAFVAALLYRRHLQRPPTAPQFKSDLGLAPEQDARVREIVRTFKLGSILSKEDILGKRVEIIEELGDPQCDREAVARMTEELNGLESQINRDFINALLSISDILEPEQRLNLIYRLSRNWFFFDRGTEKGGPHE